MLASIAISTSEYVKLARNKYKKIKNSFAIINIMDGLKSSHGKATNSDFLDVNYHTNLRLSYQILRKTPAFSPLFLYMIFSLQIQT